MHKAISLWFDIYTALLFYLINLLEPEFYI